MIFCQELQDPKRNYENQIWTLALKDVIMKKLHTLDLNSGTLHMWQVFCHWTIKADSKGFHISILVPFRTTKDSFLPVTFTGLADLFPQLGSLHQQLCGKFVYLPLMVQCHNTYNYCRGPGFESSVNFIIFSCWHPWETRFKSGFHSFFWDFICGIWKWGISSSFWYHVIQISTRQVHFQDIYFKLWIVKIFTENIYFL